MGLEVGRGGQAGLPGAGGQRGQSDAALGKGDGEAYSGEDGDTPLSDLEDGSPTASELALEFVHALIIHAKEAGVDAGDAAALAALDLIVRLAVYGRAPLKVVLDTIAAAAPVRVKLVRDANGATSSRRRSAPPS